MAVTRAEVRAWPLLAVLGAGLFLVAVDATVLHVALPDLVRQLRPGAAAQVWIVAIYPLTAAPLLLPFGTLGDRYGRRRVLVAGYAVFGVASLGCAFAPGVPALLAARAVLGCGGAMIMPATMSLLRELFPEQRRRRTAIAVCSGIAGTGSVFGPVLGAVLVEAWGWRATFLVNPLVILAAIVLALRWLPRTPPGRRRWDGVSALLAAGGVLGIAFAVGHGGVPAGVAGCVLIGLFVRRQRRTDTPLLDLTLFRRPGVPGAVGGVLLVMSTLVGLGLLFAQYLQLVLGLAPTAAATRLLLVLGASAAGSVVAPALLERFGNTRVRTAGFAVTAASLLAPAAGSVALTSPWLLGFALAGLGFGMALALTSSTDTLLSATSAEEAGGAAAVEKTGYELGAGFGTTLFGSLAAAVYAAHLTQPPGVPEAARQLAAAGPAQAEVAAAGLPGPVAEQLLAAARAACTAGLQVSAAVACGVFTLAAAVAAFRRRRWRS